ncbi:GTP cyclohydrolase 1 type 2 [Shewanella aestuarii]|uniref:Nif3-like dinuclear metal center hexameric protein n=1 Tax=Shewanella aestuarii TaxID=1028752 RepID=A0ABT0KXE0_9GAMM|nr:Nif3-like dinuclear metal center hexameric protein [Shewanella aestuarii]MCL1115837.1 Nif3-like dinuclear metal center hexameric protein [Shewanella aestuarii]GGN69067.1 GTP cyclohydrolase 1 type 2 [Shewanella aestuarii]
MTNNEIDRHSLSSYLNEFLNVAKFKDYAPNGLQVQGKDSVRTIVTGVTACQPLIEQAIALNADAILVHHGFFWKNEPEVLTGMKYKRIKALMDNDISLFGYHLPLDAHHGVGNNAQLAQQLGILNPAVYEDVPQDLLWHGHLMQPMSANDFNTHISRVLQREALHIGDCTKPIHTVAWCTGGAQDYIDHAVAMGVDAFISGEVSERTYHSAMEQNIHYFAAGHHATERYGIQALGEHIAEKFGLIHHFVDVVNPV